MATSLQRPLEARLAGIFSSLEKLHTDARLAVQMTPVFYAADAMTPLIILDIWFMSVYPWAIAAAVTVEIQKPGDYLYIAQYTPHTTLHPRARIRGNLRSCLMISLSRFE
jgi:hypothetical protein